MKPRLLLSRTDRLGDVLLSLPAVLGAQARLGDRFEIDFLVTEALVALVSPLLCSRGIGVNAYSPDGFTDWLATRHCQAAVVLFHDPHVARALKRARVPRRVGVYSKLDSFFVYNAGRLQRRSRALKSEAVYATELVDHLMTHRGFASATHGFANTMTAFQTAYQGGANLPVNPAAAQSLRRKLTLPSEYWVLHPGMGGSAENVSVETYSKIAAALQRFGDGPCLVTLGPGKSDQDFAGLATRIPGSKTVLGLTLLEFAELLRGASRVVAPSTGPLHLAHWVGTDTLGLFSPVRAQHATRWAPTGGSGNSAVWWPLLPEASSCPGQNRCLGARCPEYFCMERRESQLVEWVKTVGAGRA